MSRQENIFKILAIICHFQRAFLYEHCFVPKLRDATINGNGHIMKVISPGNVSTDLVGRGQNIYIACPSTAHVNEAICLSDNQWLLRSYRKVTGEQLAECNAEQEKMLKRIEKLEETVKKLMRNLKEIPSGATIKRLLLTNDKRNELDENLYHAVWTGNISLALDLIDRGATNDYQNIHSGTTALHGAAASGYAGVTRALLEIPGTDVNVASSDDGQTPLMYAAYNGRLEVVKILVEHGADVEAKTRDANKATALTMVIETKNNPVAEYLQQHYLGN